MRGADSDAAISARMNESVTPLAHSHFFLRTAVIANSMRPLPSRAFPALSFRARREILARIRRFLSRSFSHSARLALLRPSQRFRRYSGTRSCASFGQDLGYCIANHGRRTPVSRRNAARRRVPRINAAPGRFRLPTSPSSRLKAYGYGPFRP